MYAKCPRLQCTIATQPLALSAAILLAERGGWAGIASLCAGYLIVRAQALLIAEHRREQDISVHQLLHA